MQFQRSLSFLSVLLLLLFTQLGSALPNPAPKGLEARAAGPKAAAVNIAARWGDNENYDVNGNGNGNDDTKSNECDECQRKHNSDTHTTSFPPDDGSEHNQNNTCNGGQCQNKHNDCEGDECQNKNNNCDNDCQSNAIGFISYIQGGINREVDLIKQYGTQISSDECNKHINNIRQYIGSVSSKTSNYGSQWYGGDTGGAQVQISSVVSTINDLINYLLSANINANVYSSVVPSLCNEVGSWFQVSNSVGLGIQTSVSSISSFTQLSASKFGVSISL